MNVKLTLGKTGQRRGGSFGLDPIHQARTQPCEIAGRERNFFLHPLRLKLLGRDAQRIAPRINSGGLIIPFQQGIGVIRPTMMPAVYEPLRVGISDRRLAFTQFSQALQPLGFFAQGIAEDSIDEPGLVAEIMPSGEVDRFIHRGVIRYSVELKYLV